MQENMGMQKIWEKYGNIKNMGMPKIWEKYGAAEESMGDAEHMGMQ